jgi:hypothetical protein
MGVTICMWDTGNVRRVFFFYYVPGLCAMVLTCGRVSSYYRCTHGCPVAHTVVYMEKPVFTMGVGPLTR